MAGDGLHFVNSVRRKIESAQAQIRQIACVDFPYEDPRLALDSLKRALDGYLEVLAAALASDDLDTIVEACKMLNLKIVEYHPLLGFLLRATNIRNSFEVYDPLKELTRLLLDHKPGVILSSEWEFSPFTYPTASDDLPGFVLIGLPASEAGNALILPLAGHELAHSIWSHGDVGSTLDPEINVSVAKCYLSNADEFTKIFQKDCTIDNLLNQPVLDYLSLSCDISGRQCEEIFCDAMGVRLFGESFIHSFEYLIVPSLGGNRSEYYPPLDTRLEYLRAAAAAFSIPLVVDHQPPVREAVRNLPARQGFALRMADAASATLLPTLLQRAEDYCERRKVPKPAPEIAREIAMGFRACVPAQGARHMANIINAGWEVYMELVGSELALDAKDGEFEILNNLMFKSLEVLEYEMKVTK
jgi:hypothetical protein